MGDGAAEGLYDGAGAVRALRLALMMDCLLETVWDNGWS